MSEHQIAVREEAIGLAPDARPTDLISIIAQVATDPRMDVEKMERLLAMQERVIADERKIAFAAALAELQAECPQIEKDGRVVVKGVERSRYAKYETIDEYVRPLLAKYGFSISFDEAGSEGDIRRFSATLTHRKGHAETKFKTMPFDRSEYRSAAQSEGSTTSYARRSLLKMHLNLVERDEDTDGRNLEPISEDQVKDIDTTIADLGMNKARFLLYMGVGAVADIVVRDLNKVAVAFQVQRESIAAKKAKLG